MSLDPAACLKRKCVFYQGTIYRDAHPEDEQGEFHICDAFLEYPGIPLDIVRGENLHMEPVPGQKNEIVYRKSDDEIKMQV